MKSNRCSNTMIYQKFYSLQEHFFGWRCILCGEIIGYLILMDAGSQRLSSLRDQSKAGSEMALPFSTLN
jgi:hypothetical protein